jgi:vacuolar-type H+-ATPase subunit F/Vma7
MSVAAIGEPERVAGYGLAGAAVFPAPDPETVLAAWEALPDDAELLILSRSARILLGSRLDERRLVWVEVPE